MLFIFFAENAAKKKSQTLPSSSVNHPSNYAQHQRSLSESKTADVLSNIENVQSFLHTPKMNTYGNKFLSNRHRDCSESSTSGVSSDDSVIGKYTIGERVQTLSPIPSSSSLSTLKPSFYQQHRGRHEIGRRVYSKFAYFFFVFYISKSIWTSYSGDLRHSIL